MTMPIPEPAVVRTVPYRPRMARALAAGGCRALILLVGAASMVVVLAGAQATAWLLGPAFMALIIVIAVSPVQGWLRRHG